MTDFWDGYVPEPDGTCSNTLRIQGKAYPRTCKKCGLGPCVELAQQALDKMAENARELGLDYEPAQREPVVVFRKVRVGEYVLRFWPSDNGWMCGITSGMMQALAEQPAQRTWVSLTDEELSEVYNQADWDTVNGWQYERAIEAKLRSKNEDRN